MDEEELWFLYQTAHATVHATFRDAQTRQLIFAMQEDAVDLLQDELEIKPPKPKRPSARHRA